MKIKNIMFSGAMASILMIGGAYAADNRLTTVDYVKGAYNTMKTNLTTAGATNLKVLNATNADTAAAVTADAVDGSTVQLSNGKIAVKTITDSNIADGSISKAKINGLVSDLQTITADITNLKAATGDAGAVATKIADSVAEVKGYTDAEIQKLDSSTTELSAGQYLTGVTIADGKITSQTSATLPTASDTAKGMAKVDNTTIVAADGVISVKSGVYETAGAATAAIDALDAEVSTDTTTTGTDDLDITINEVNGVITSVSGTIGAGKVTFAHMAPGAVATDWNE